MNLFNFFKKKSKENPAPFQASILNYSEVDVISELEKEGRTAYVPVIQGQKASFNTQSKFGGLPYIDKENMWPVCPNCNKNMTFFLQINLHEVEEGLRKGLLQFFYCTNLEKECDMELETYRHDSRGYVVRIISNYSTPLVVEHNAFEVFPERCIKEWQPKKDYPSYQEYNDIISNALNEDDEEKIHELDLGPLEGEKLFGWPHWVQGVEYPRQDSKKIEMIFQIDSHKHIPYEFGDGGIGHIFRDIETDELYFGWACY